MRAGYEFGGWFIDEACERAWSFDQPVSSDLTLFAKWIPAGASIDPDDGQDAGGQQGAQWIAEHDTPPTDGEAEELAREIDRRLCEAWGEIFSLAVLEWRDGQ